MKTLRLRVTGRVQGVFFRQNTREQARVLGLTGWVRNDADGSVEIVTTGEAAGLEAFLAWCHKGPPKAAVQNVTCTETALQEFDSFEIRR